MARFWQAHYYDVPFGCQPEFIVSLQSGILNLAAWHPGVHKRKDQYSAVYYLNPGHCQPDGASVLLFPDFSGKDRWPKRIRIGPRVPWEPGTALFIGATECGLHALGMGLRMVLSHIAVGFAPTYLAGWGNFAESLPANTNTAFYPVAITVDHRELERDGKQSAIKAVAQLIAWNE
jgi:hypothetical protein